MWDVLLDALIDSLKLLPILLAVYILIEFLEAKTASKLKHNKLLKGGYAPLLGSAVGIVPQCGFSVVATDLYTKNAISVGTLLAVYIATSDEALPIMIANPGSYKYILPMLAIKFVLALVVGYLAYFLVRGKKKANVANDRVVAKSGYVGYTNLQVKHMDVQYDYVVADMYMQDDHDKGCCGHDIETNKWKQFLLHPLIHSLKIFAYILVVNVILGIVMHYAEDGVMNFLHSAYYAQPFLAGLVGLIPNCASSVILTELFVGGALSFGACMAGLIVNAGIALAVLVKENKNKWNTVAIISTLYLIGSVAGIVVNLIVRT